MEYLVLDARRDGYAPDQIDYTMTVGELIEFLECYEYDMPVILSHDRGYTYGAIKQNRFETEYEEE